MFPPVRLYHPTNADRVAVVSVEPVFGKAGTFYVRIARGAKANALTGGGTFGPYNQTELTEALAAAVLSLRGEGFDEQGFDNWQQQLFSGDSKTCARSALKLGWQGRREAVEPILQLLPQAVDELCPLLDALGMLGDPRAIPPLREQASRQLLSRRRSAVEALRQIGDAEGLATVRQQTLDTLGGPFAALLGNPATTPLQLHEALQQVESKRLAYTLDLLYEIDHPLANQAVREQLADLTFSQPFVWRYVKSIYKRSMLRHDPEMFGWLTLLLERQARTGQGQQAVVKSGYDGQQRTSWIFGRKTRHFIRRLGWRYLRQVALYRPALYTRLAASVLAHYDSLDQRIPKGRLGQYAECYFFHRIFWTHNPQYTLDDRRLVFRNQLPGTAPPAPPRLEAYPELWDACLVGYLHLLAFSNLSAVQEFAHHAIGQRHPQLIQEASLDHLLPMLVSPFERTATLALRELRRRFDPQQPDWEILDRCLRDTRPFILQIARDWLAETAPLWTRQPDRAIAYLQCPDGLLREIVIQRVIETLRTEATLRRQYAPPMLALLRQPPEHVEGIARVVQHALLEELREAFSVTELFALLAEASPAIQSVAAHLFVRRIDSPDQFDWQTTVALAGHEVQAVREAAHHLLQRFPAYFARHPDALFALAESDWPDSRTAAGAVLRDVIPWATAGLNPLLGLLDSNFADTQQLGRELARKYWDTLNPAELTEKLAEHSHPAMQAFALELVEQHLPAGVEPLKQQELFFRRILLSLTPRRALKDRLLNFLQQRGEPDSAQARWVVDFLQQLLSTDTRQDFQRLLQLITTLQLEHPEITSRVILREVGT